jgi:hypothetical protein
LPSKAGTLDFVAINAKFYKVLGYTADSIPGVPPPVRTGPLSYADRQGEETSAQGTWHHGFGRGEIRASQSYLGRVQDPEDIGRYHYSQNCDPRFRGQIILAPLLSTDTISTNAEAKVQFIYFNGVWHAFGARYLHTLSGTTWTSASDMGASAAMVKGCATVFGGKLYWCDGNSIVYSKDSAGSIVGAITGMTKPILAAAVGTTMWIMSNKNQLQSSTDGATLATAISVGSGVDIATALLDYNGYPHIAKPDGLFFYDGQNLWNVYPELARRIKTTNGQGAAVGRGTVFLPFGPQVVGYSADLIVPDVVNLLPDRVQGVEARGAFLDFAPDSDFLWGLFKSQGGNYYITSYDYNPTPGQGWHQVVNTGTTAVTAIAVAGDAAAPYVLYGEGTTIKRFLLAQNSVNPHADTNYRYAASGDIYLSQEVDDFDDIKKSYISLVLDTAGCAAGITVTIKYTVDAGSELTLGAAITTNGPQELFFPAGTTGKRLSIHLVLATNDSTKTPQVFPIAKRFKRRFTRVAKWTMMLDCAMSDTNVRQDPLTAYTNLITAANTVDGVAFTDIDGTAYTAFVETVDDKTDPTKQADQYEKIVQVTLTQKRTS